MMRNTHGKILCAVLLVAALCVASSGATSSTGTTGSPQFYFINGVSVAAYLGRKQSAQILQTRLQSLNEYPTSLPVIALPNPSQGLFADIFLKLVLQKQMELDGDFKSAVIQTVQMIDGDPTVTPSPSDEVTYNQALAVLNENAAASTEYTSAIAPTVQTMCSQVIAAMQTGHPVVIVGHSEGTMYANEIASVVRGFIPASFDASALPAFSHWMKVVDLATPASQAPDGIYATARQDLVIEDLARALSAIAGLGQPLPANEDFPNAHRFDALGHGLAAVYLNPQVDATNAVPARIASAAAALPKSPPPVLSGAVTGLPPSGRFAVMKPDGSLVYPQGGFTVSASNIEAGDYVFGATVSNPVDCFSGAWSAQVAYLTDTLPGRSGAASAGGSVSLPGCGTGAFEPMLTIRVAADSATGGWTIAAE